MSVKKLATIVARELRKNMTREERIFWEWIRDKKMMGYRFLRQHPIYFNVGGKERFFIADFYCKELSLVIEIDGGIHEKQKEYDRQREEILKNLKGLRILRFKNKEIVENKLKVINELKRFVLNLKSSEKNKISEEVS